MPSTVDGPQISQLNHGDVHPGSYDFRWLHLLVPIETFDSCWTTSLDSYSRDYYWTTTVWYILLATIGISLPVIVM